MRLTSTVPAYLCARLAPQIAGRALAELDTTYHDLRVRSLFTTRADEEGLPSRSGYWLGDRVLRRLMRDHPTRELLAWDHPTARRARRLPHPTGHRGGPARIVPDETVVKQPE
jgi:hypothetical protein